MCTLLFIFYYFKYKVITNSTEKQYVICYNYILIDLFTKGRVTTSSRSKYENLKEQRT